MTAYRGWPLAAVLLVLVASPASGQGSAVAPMRENGAPIWAVISFKKQGE